MRRITIHHKFTEAIGGRLGHARDLCMLCMFCIAVVMASSAQTFTSLAYFNDVNGANPDFGPLVQGPDGNFYGVTLDGGDMACSAPWGCGTVFRVTPSGSLTTLHIFEMTDGGGPAGLVLGTDGSFYGTAEVGGSNS